MEEKDIENGPTVEEESQKENNDSDTQDQEKSKINAEKLLNDIISGIQDKTEEFGKTITDYKTALQKPLTDVIETEGSLIVKIDLPGVKKEDIDLGISEDSIEIKTIFEEEVEGKC